MSPDITVKNSSEQGFTLIDSLVGVVAISVVLVLIAPPLLLITVTRVKHQRAEQAMQLARAQVDSVRVLMVQNQNQSANLPTVSSPSPGYLISNTTPPTVLTTSTANGTGVTTIPVNSSFTPGGVDNFVVQVFRDQGVSDANGNLINFRMGVRVYGPEVLTSANIGQVLQPNSASLSLSSIVNINSPLAVIYTEVSKYDSLGASLNDYRNLINTTCTSPQSGICQ